MVGGLSQESEEEVDGLSYARGSLGSSGLCLGFERGDDVGCRELQASGRGGRLGEAPLRRCYGSRWINDGKFRPHFPEFQIPIFSQMKAAAAIAMVSDGRMKTRWHD